MEAEKKPAAPLTDEQKLRRWKSWIPRIRADLGGLLHKHEIFCGVRAIMNENPDARTPGMFANWMVQNYVDSVVIGIRRQVDTIRTHETISLGQLLKELSGSPGILTRDWHRRQYHWRRREMADGVFAMAAGARATAVTPAAIRRDQKRLEKAVERVKKFVNKRVAHAAPRRQLRRNPTFGDITAALETLEKVAGKYAVLLTGSGRDIRPVIQTHWKKVFFEPWIDEYDRKGDDNGA